MLRFSFQAPLRMITRSKSGRCSWLKSWMSRQCPKPYHAADHIPEGRIRQLHCKHLPVDWQKQPWAESGDLCPERPLASWTHKNFPNYPPIPVCRGTVYSRSRGSTSPSILLSTSRGLSVMLIPAVALRLVTSSSSHGWRYFTPSQAHTFNTEWHPLVSTIQAGLSVSCFCFSEGLFFAFYQLDTSPGHRTSVRERY